MVKCEVIKEFTLKRFKELKNLKRKRIERNGNKLNTGDIFECAKEMAEYLTGNNPENEQVVRIIEVIPEKDAKPTEIVTEKEEITEEEVQAVVKAIVEESEERKDTVENIVNEIIEEAEETEEKKPKKTTPKKKKEKK